MLMAVQINSHSEEVKEVINSGLSVCRIYDMEFVTFWANPHPRILFYLLLAVLYKRRPRTIKGAFRRLPWISQRHHGVQTMGQVWMDDWLAGDRRRVEILLQPLNYGWDGEMGSQMPNNHFHSSSCCARPWAVSYTLFCKRPGWWWWLASHVLNRAIYGTGWRYDREFVRCHYHEIT